MGVSIHYRGKMTDITKINVLCDELASVAEKKDWTCTRLDDDWSKPSDATIEVTEIGPQISGHLALKGIAFSIHPKCESLRFFFDAGGNLRDPVSMALINEGALKPDDAWIAVKTQFTDPQTHIWIVGLLKYIQEHYLPELQVRDEGEFWETGDHETLKEKMNLITEKIDSISGELSRVAGSHLEKLSADDLASMIEALILNRFNDKLRQDG
jgi:hypothetical protein